jgi:NCS1 family nucleobase:cation symporter-1
MVFFILFVQDTTVLRDFVALLVVWLAPFAAVWITDGVLRRWRFEPESIDDLTARGRYWGWHGFNLRGWSALLAGVVVCLLTIDAPILQGPVSALLEGADLTWTLGPLVSAAAYWAQSRRSARACSTAAARVSTSSLR